MDPEKLKALKEKLKTYSKDKILVKQHALVRLGQRRVSKEAVILHLQNPENLIDAIEEPALRQHEKKYKLVFDLTGKSLIVVAALNKVINIVTVIYRYRKWVRPVELKEAK